SEIKLLKTLIVENRSNLEELRLAEQDSEAQDTQDSAKYTHVLTPDGRIPYPQEQKPQVSSKQPRSPRGRSPISDPVHSKTEYPEAEKADEEVSDLEGKDPEDKTDPCRTDKEARKINAIQEGLTQPPPPYRGPSETSMHRESNLLLQMVPYTSGFLNPRPPQYPITGTRGPDNDVKSGMQEATSNIRLLLDKWTKPGSGPVADLLAEEAAKDADREAELRPDSTANAHPAPRKRATTAENDPYHDSDYNVRDDNSPTSSFHRPTPNYKRPSVGDDFLTELRLRRAGIVYMKRNKFQLFHYVDNECFYTSNLVPPHTMQSREIQYTELGQGLVKKEALDLLGYSYEQIPSGHLSIVGDLSMFAIEELVQLSYQALQRTLDVQSEGRCGSRSRHQKFDFTDQSYKEEDWRPACADYDDRRPDGFGTQRDTRRGTSRGTGNNRTKRRHRPAPAITTLEEIDRARDRLAILRTREVESEKANDSQRVADLRNYAIPDQEKKVSELRKKLKDHQRDKFRHPEVDTESESGDRDDLPATNGV
ncbi:MAG: hypothetical protein Q9193_006148, partial [Seirophora villosa]